MDPALLVLLALLVAVLYSSVGHGGASGYLAAMALAGMAPTAMKPTALVLNLLVAGLGSLRYIRQGCFRLDRFWPFAAGSIPFAFLGGATATGAETYKRILGVILILTAIALLLPRKTESAERPLPLVVAVIIGASIGFVSGLIGVGGGIFLSPLLILAGWATTRETVGISSLFILVNSAAGLAGHLSSLQSLPSLTPWLGLAAFLGGLLGTEMGARRLTPGWVRILLAAVLLLASVKLIFV